MGVGQEPEVTVINLKPVAGEEYTYTFVTDRFSTYAIIYTEIDISDDWDDDDMHGDTDTDSSTGVPKTGDAATPFAWSLALVVAMSALTVCVKRLTKKRG